MKPIHCLASVLLALVLVVPALAQSPQEFLHVYTIDVKPGANAQFEAYIQKILEAADNVGAQQTWVASQVAYGSSLNRYLFASQMENWDALDGWTAVPKLLEQAYGKEEGAKILNQGRATIANLDSQISRLLPELSYNNDGAASAPMYRVRVARVRRDMQDEYRGFVRRVNEARAKAGDTRKVVRRNVVMGDSPVYVSARPFSKFSELGGGEGLWELLEKAHGAAETRRLRDALQKSVVEGENYVLVVRPDLSRREAKSASDQ